MRGDGMTNPLAPVSIAVVEKTTVRT